MVIGMVMVRHFNLLKAFGYIERVVESEFLSLGKYLFYIIRAQHVLSDHLIKIPLFEIVHLQFFFCISFTFS